MFFCMFVVFATWMDAAFHDVDGMGEMDYLPICDTRGADVLCDLGEFFEDDCGIDGMFTFGAEESVEAQKPSRGSRFWESAEQYEQNLEKLSRFFKGVGSEGVSESAVLAENTWVKTPMRLLENVNALIVSKDFLIVYDERLKSYSISPKSKPQPESCENVIVALYRLLCKEKPPQFHCAVNALYQMGYTTHRAWCLERYKDCLQAMGFVKTHTARSKKTADLRRRVFDAVKDLSPVNRRKYLQDLRRGKDIGGLDERVVGYLVKLHRRGVWEAVRAVEKQSQSEVKVCAEVLLWRYVKDNPRCDLTDFLEEALDKEWASTQMRFWSVLTDLASDREGGRVMYDPVEKNFWCEMTPRPQHHPDESALMHFYVLHRDNSGYSRFELRFLMVSAGFNVGGIRRVETLKGVLKLLNLVSLNDVVCSTRQDIKRFRLVDQILMDGCVYTLEHYSKVLKANIKECDLMHAKLIRENMLNGDLQKVWLAHQAYLEDQRRIDPTRKRRCEQGDFEQILILYAPKLYGLLFGVCEIVR